MKLLKYFNKKNIFFLALFSTSLLYAYNSASIKPLFIDEKQEKIKYEEEYKLVSINPFYEGEKLAKEDEINYMQELKIISMQEFDDADTINTQKKARKKQVVKIEEKTLNKKEEINQDLQRKIGASIYEILAYEEILIEVDSKTNKMNVKVKINNEYKNIKTYKVSTAKKDIKKPLGIGNISKISLKPTWYPTQKTKNIFKERGIILPNEVPFGHKYNYMGAAKINLTHMLNDKEIYRIHGTSNEKVIETDESSAYIRMKNDEILELSSLLNEFAAIKNLNKIKVLLK